MISSIFKLLRSWNRKRLQKKRIREMLRNDIPSRRFHVNPNPGAKHILIVDALFGIGDALYAHGLVKALSEAGLVVSVATMARTRHVYARSPYVQKLYVLEYPDDLQDAINETFDVAVDLAYVGLDRWDLRVNLLKHLNIWTISCSSMARSANVIDEILDLAHVAHVGERMNIIYQALTGKTIGYISPFILTDETDDFLYTNSELPIVYVNTTGSEANRCMSESQILALENYFNQTRKAIAFFYITPSTNLTETPFVKRILPKTINRAARLISKSILVITPDTSITHIASVFNKPTIVLYCGDEMDYFQKHEMRETWAPLSKTSICLTANQGTRDNHNLFPISNIPPTQILDAIRTILMH